MLLRVLQFYPPPLETVPLTYRVYIPNEVKKVLGHPYVELPCPSINLAPGMKLAVLRPFVTAGLRVYREGDHLNLIRRTMSAPHGYLSNLGNWEVECSQTISVWSSIESMVAEGTLSRCGTPSSSYVRM